MVGGPALMMIGFVYLAGASLVPLMAGLIGLTRRAVYIYTGILISLVVLLESWVFTDELKYQSAARLFFRDTFLTGLITAQLLLAFMFSHWIGASIRAVFAWMIGRLRSRIERQSLG